MAFTEAQLRKKIAAVQEHITDYISHADRETLADNLQELLPDGKRNKDLREHEAMTAAIKALRSKRKVLHAEMLTIYGGVIGTLFDKPKKMDQHVHNMISYVTLLLV